jgi:NAD(P)-dependent dehydrogenase (short-subunit alcohol dehydrogenase family)
MMTEEQNQPPCLQDRVAIVTGGASGIGRATVLLLAEQGAQVYVGDRDLLPENEELFAQYEITQIACDVRSEEEVQRLVQQAAEQQRIDILVNNAGVGLVKQITEVTEAEWDHCLDTNLKGAFLTCKHVIPWMAKHGGSIINISSNAGILPRAHDPVYSISKHALVALTKSLALCHSSQAIRINAVCPGPVGDTGMMNADLAAAADPQALVAEMIAASPLARTAERMITPQEVAQAVLYLASDASAMVTGTCIAVDGGKSLGVPPPL